MIEYIYLALAIVFEVLGTSAIKASSGFTRPLPSLVVLVGYGASFYFLSMALKTFPIGITYAIWSGLGIVMITLIGFIFYDEKPDLAALLGMALIIAGVLVIHLFSNDF